MEIPEGTIDVLDIFIRGFVGNRHVILGISGGIDSTMVSFLLKRNVKKQKIHLYSLPFGSEIPDVEKASKFLDIPYETVNMKGFLGKYSEYEKDEKILGNVKARLRMIFLYMMSNKYSGLVAGTSNKSELLTGYFTKYGDGGSDFQPIGDLYKTQVYLLAKELNFPEWLLSKKPSAELWKGQTDEEELGVTYDKLDQALECLEYLRPAKECKIKGCSPEEIERIYSLVRKSEHKRVNFYIPKISYRTIGTDWME